MSRSQQTREKERLRREQWKKRRPDRPLSSATSTSETLPFHVDDAFEGKNVNVSNSESLGLPQLSDRINDLIQPYCNANVSYERMVMIGIAAWNVSVVPKEVRDEMILDFTLTAFPKIAMQLAKSRTRSGKLSTKAIFSAVNPEEFLELISFDEMLRTIIDRKIAMFPEDRRYIVRHKVEYKEDGMSLSIAAHVPPEMCRSAS